MTAKALAEEANVTTVSLSRIKTGKQEPSDATIERIAAALGYPTAFFVKDDPDPVPEAAVSFRSLAAATQRERKAAIAAGTLAYEVADWLTARYNVPPADLIDHSQERDPAGAARALRQHWSLGERPIGNLVRLLEAKGVRVFSLAENTQNVDAFSCWRGAEPYVFLNTFKTTERSRFDAAHELGHLVLHRHGGSNQGDEAEAQANAFASSFLMPRADVIASVPRTTRLDQLVRAKRRWGVSVSALVYRMHKLGLLTDWQRRTFYVQIRKRFGTSEPDGLPRERSAVWDHVLRDLWQQRRTKADLASELGLPHEELENLLFGLTAEQGTEVRQTPRTEGSSLSLVIAGDGTSG